MHAPLLRTAVFVVVAAFALNSAKAIVLVQYQFGTPGQETTNETGPAYGPTITGANLTATPVTDPLNTVGIEISSAAIIPANAPFLRVDPQGNSADAVAAVANNKYFQFTLSPAGDLALDLDNLTFDVARGGAGTPRGYVVRSSLDGFTNNLAQADVGTTRPNYTAVSVDLNSFAPSTSPVVFRIYSYSTGAGASVDYDNVTVNGGVVPEPSAIGLLIVGSLGLMSSRRRPG